MTTTKNLPRYPNIRYEDRERPRARRTFGILVTASQAISIPFYHENLPARLSKVNADYVWSYMVSTSRTIWPNSYFATVVEKLKEGGINGGGAIVFAFDTNKETRVVPDEETIQKLKDAMHLDDSFEAKWYINW